jgi:hypothetical protein
MRAQGMQQDGPHVSFMSALRTVSVHNTCNFSIKKKKEHFWNTAV